MLVIVNAVCALLSVAVVVGGGGADVVGEGDAGGGDVVEVVSTCFFAA